MLQKRVYIWMPASSWHSCTVRACVSVCVHIGEQVLEELDIRLLSSLDTQFHHTT